MTHTVAALARTPNALAPHYARFRVAERVLLTGHSHQAWPDVGFEGLVQAWNDAAETVDEKWGRAAEKADRVRRGFARLLGESDGDIALGQNTHELLIRFLSALPLDERPRLVTTDGEFHTIRRQLDRLAETRWLEIVKVSARPAAAIAERLVTALDDRTAVVLTSSVLFGNAHIVPALDWVLEACRRVGAELLVDAYHQLNVVPFSLRGLEDAFVVGGGYKYCQLGEGNCFLRVPPERDHMRPVLTGWFSEFGKLSDPVAGGDDDRLHARERTSVPYGEGSAQWAGSTYDPTSHYRAARVFDFFEEQALTPELLREVSEHQIALLASEFDALDLDPRILARDRSIPLHEIGGFLALQSPEAGALSKRLRARDVWTDHRGDLLRLGPAPYLSDAQLRAAMATVGEVVHGL